MLFFYDLILTYFELAELKLNYLKEGEMYYKKEHDKRGKQLSTNLHAKSLFPLMMSKTFLVETNNGYQIVDTNGRELGASFVALNTGFADEVPKQIWDYIFGSKYLFIANNERKIGMIDGSGRVIVPCEYIQVKQLDSVFKNKGLMIY